MARCLVTSLFIRSHDDPALEPLLRDGHQVEFVDGLSVRSEAALAAALQGVAATLASVEPYTASVISQASDLKVISRTGVGFDAVDLAAATQHGVVVCTTPGTNHHAVADMALALLLACARGIVQGAELVRAGRWTPQPRGVEIRAATIGVLGTGLIGREVIQRLAGFGPRILAYDVVQSAELVERFGITYVAFDELLHSADFLTLHAPLLAETRHIINRDALRLMKPTAYVINTARGPLIDEAALAEALRQRQIAGAGLDVFDTEPLPLDSPLRGLDNVLLTPHMAGTTDQSRAAMAHMAADNAARVLRGEPPLTCVNPAVLARSGH
jgi:phosphoglycerate dehydrogenase-like enzyme